MRSMVWLLPLVVVACSPQNETADWRSGSRLRARFYAAGDAKLFQTWHDTKLDFDCSFSTAADGQLRCQPQTTEATFFADSGCSQPVVPPAPDCAGPTFFTAPSSAGYCTRPDVWKAGATQQLDHSYTLDASTGDCTVSTKGPAVVQTGTRIEAAQLVSAVLHQESRGDRLGIEILQAADGAIEPRSIVDRQRGFACFAPPNAQLGHCVPDDLGGGAGFSDAQCQHPALVSISCTSEPLTAASLFDFGRCGMLVEPTVIAAGPRLSDRYFKYVDGSCGEVQPSADPEIHFYDTGATLAPAELAPLAYRSEGKGAVLVQAVVAPGGQRLRANGLFDGGRAASCQPTVAADGLLRCLPSSFQATSVYSDAGCTKPLLRTTHDCAAPPVFATLDPVTDGCAAAKVHVFAPGARVTPTATYLLSGDCTKLAVSPSADYYELGAEIDPATLPPVTLTTD
jgi:hypothetical protein